MRGVLVGLGVMAVLILGVLGAVLWTWGVGATATTTHIVTVTSTMTAYVMVVVYDSNTTVTFTTMICDDMGCGVVYEETFTILS